VVPPDTGIVHQVNLEYLARACSWRRPRRTLLQAYPDTLVGTDSHTTMINGLGVLGWGVGGIEAEAAMLGQPISMLIPQVVGFRLTGRLPEGATATDLVLVIVETAAQARRGRQVRRVLRRDGLDDLPLADRATIANMAPEYGATCGIFPIDDETLRYLRLTGRDPDRSPWSRPMPGTGPVGARTAPPRPATPTCWNWISAPWSRAWPGRASAGPGAPRARPAWARRCDTLLRSAPSALHSRPERFEAEGGPHRGGRGTPGRADTATDARQHERGGVHAGSRRRGDRGDHLLHQHLQPLGDARRRAGGPQGAGARPEGEALGEDLAGPRFQGGHRVPEQAGLLNDLEALGFHVVGYGCTTCIGNSGPLPEPISEAILKDDLIVTSVLSGNRNFEGRIHSEVRMNFLASPPLVVAYALAGTMAIDLLPRPDRQDAGATPST
jgi:aconitate hydratase